MKIEMTKGVIASWGRWYFAERVRDIIMDSLSEREINNAILGDKKEGKMNKIILSADTKFEDKDLAKIVNKLWVKIEALNDRTKAHTLQIKALEKRIKALKSRS